MLNSNIKEVIDKKKENVIKKHKEYIISVTFTFPVIGCNANCLYCSQKINKKEIFDLDVTTFIKKDLEKILTIAKKEKKQIDFIIIGGELKALSLENQLKLISLVNELKKNKNIRRIEFVVNDTKLDSPLMKIKNVCYIVHILNWKNKKIDYDLDLYSENESINYGTKSFFKVVITDDDTIEDIKNFLKLNPSLPVNFSYNTQSEKYKDFNYMENFYKQVYKLSKNVKTEHDNNIKFDFYDFKHRRYLCRYKLVKNFGFDYSDNKYDNYYNKHIRFCCNEKPYHIELKKLDTLDVKEEYFHDSCKECGNIYSF